MATKVHGKSCEPGYFSMRDLNEDSSSNWPQFYGDQTLANGQFCNSYMPGSFGDAYPGAHKDALKQTMLEHEATFKHQVFELHRLYTRQRDMMDEIKRKDLQRHWILMETSSSSSPLVSEIPYEDDWKWHKPNFPFGNSGSARPSISVAENSSSPLSCTKGNGKLASRIPFQNGCSSKDCEILEVRPSKVRKKLFDLQLPADVYIDTEEGKQSPNYNISNISRNPLSRIQNIPSESSVKSNFGSVLEIDYDGDASRFGSCLRNSVGLADLNELILVEEATVPTSIDFIGRGACPAEIKDVDLGAKPKSQFLLGLSNEILENSQQGSNNGTSITPQVENKRKAREWSSYTYEAVSAAGKTHHELSRRRDLKATNGFQQDREREEGSLRTEAPRVCEDLRDQNSGLRIESVQVRESLLIYLFSSMSRACGKRR